MVCLVAQMKIVNCLHKQKNKKIKKIQKLSTRIFSKLGSFLENIKIQVL